MQPTPCEKISVQGLVQGVGFRPTVWQIAIEHHLVGEVYNDGQGVQIIAQASQQTLNSFIDQLKTSCPPLARIEQIKRESFDPVQVYSGFSITSSLNSTVQTGIAPDAATCQACLSEINNPDNRRYGYAFTNCTHCGPRLSIIKDIPYDRINTSMAEFNLCPACELEYLTPSDRRFHAQPNACSDCGPELCLVDNAGGNVKTQDAIAHTAKLLEQGHIIAIKGIGGYQLACDASNDKVVIELRRRKSRSHKALALMARDLDQIRQSCKLSNEEAALLQSHPAPILILSRLQTPSSLSEYISPAQNSLGFMLPYSPLHHLLLQHLSQPIVLTSGNNSDQPQCIDNQQAQHQLETIADYFLHHNRTIVNRVDDSVMRIINKQVQFYRRARGYAPSPVELPKSFPAEKQILACGGELKNTFAMLQNHRVTLSQHMGNLENAATYDDYLKNLDLYRRMFQFNPEVIVIDKHPEYLSSKYGRQLADENNLPLIEVQHHHAHIGACLVDNQWSENDGPVIGVALDGLGYGDDDTFWGGEFMLADYAGFKRLARFKPTPMPGGSRCMHEPWRNTLAQLITHCDWIDVSHSYQALDLFQYLAGKPVKTLQRMIENSLNTPITSSCGRLFDAVAAAVGVCRDQISYEGQAAIELEALVDSEHLAHYTPYPFTLEQDELLEIDPATMWLALLQDLKNRVSAQKIASRFHLCVAHMISTVVARMSHEHTISSVALSGGVFQNPTLLTLVMNNLQEQGLEVLIHHQVPANDGGISLGQAAVAAVTMREKTRLCV